MKRFTQYQNFRMARAAIAALAGLVLVFNQPERFIGWILLAIGGALAFIEWRNPTRIQDECD